MTKRSFQKEIELPEGVNVDITGNIISVKGPRGELKRKFLYPGVKIEVKDNKVIFKVKKFSKKEKTMVGTFLAHLNFMIKGVKEGFVYKLKVCSVHFPMNVSVQGNELIIKNFLGERVPRKAKILEGVNVKVEGPVVLVESIDKEAAGQTAANIEQSTRIANRDRRRFVDGIWMFVKANKELVK